MTGSEDSLDSILTHVGEFGKYQMFVFACVCLAVASHSSVHVAYIFTAMDLNYRCEVPGCDTVTPDYDPLWLANAVPFSDDEPSKCNRYIVNNATHFDNCTKPSDFITKTETCNSFVYETDEYSILREFDLHCDNNLWKLTMVGTVNNIGQFFGLFISGIASDRFGRKIVLILGLMLCGICGLIRSFSPSYEFFLAFEFLDAAFGAGTYVCGFILGVELVGPQKRVLTGILASSCYAVGEVFAAGSAWLVQSWKPIIYILYSPPLFIFFYFWLIPESVRWNLSKGRTEQAKQTLKRLAQVNGKEISDSALDKLALSEETESKDSYLDVLKSKTLLLRFINCCFCWITCAFLFYGLSLNSVALNGNSYLDFILTSLVEIPAYIACNYLIDRLGRKWSLSGSFFLTGISCLAFLFIPDEAESGRLAAYLVGKFGATAAFTVAYVLTSELFPTRLRHSMMGACSTFGRIGSIVAPQTPLLAQAWYALPIVMFSSMATIAGLLSLLFPETVGIKLPDTVEEAERIGKTDEKYLPK